MNKNFWLPGDGGCLADGDTSFGSPSRIESKRPHQWFSDASEQELLCSKKQAVAVANSRPMHGISDVNASLLGNSSGYQSLTGQFSDYLFGPGPVRTCNIPGRNSSSVDVEERGFDNQSGNDFFSLSMPQARHDPSCLGHGVKKVKVNQVKDSDNCMPMSMGSCYTRGDNNTIPTRTTFVTSDSNIMLGPTHSNEIGSTYSKMGENFISMGQTFNKGDGNLVLMGHSYSKGNDSTLLMGQPFDKGDCSFVSMDHRYGKEDGNIMSLSPGYSKGLANFLSVGSTYNKTSKSFGSIDCTHHKVNENMISVGLTRDKADDNAVSIGTNYDKEDSSIISICQNLDKGEGTTVSFGRCEDEPEANNPCGSIITTYDYLIGQSLVPASKEKDLLENDTGLTVTGAPASASRADRSSKSKEQRAPKKIPPNSFPSNVKSLLSTGIFDDVPVKYVSWSREKNIRGIIKGTSYLCGCDDCQHSKALNAYEFERHAGCKTKHPNNHIYFENGKTIYSVVQELKGTSQEMLFDAIQSVTGSPINQKNFCIWKASYQAATRELQRIYGKDKVFMAS